MKTLMMAVYLMFSASAYAETVQHWCEVEADNAQKMYHVVTSDAHKNGQISDQEIVAHFRKQTSLFASNLNLELLSSIDQEKANISAEDVSNWIHKRCTTDYNNYMAWFKIYGNSR